MERYFKVMTVLGEVVGYVRGRSEAEAAEAAKASAKYLELAGSYLRHAGEPLVEAAGLRLAAV